MERVVRKEGAVHRLVQRCVQRAKQDSTSGPLVDQVIRIVVLGLSNAMLSSSLDRETRIVVNNELHLVFLGGITQVGHRVQTVMRKVRDQLASNDREVDQLGDLLLKSLLAISFIFLRKHGSKLSIVHPHFGS